MPSHQNQSKVFTHKILCAAVPTTFVVYSLLLFLLLILLQKHRQKNKHADERKQKK